MPLPPPSPASTVVVTGASSGIGAELARELARRQYNVTLVARRVDRLDELAAELQAAHRVQADVERCDLRDEGERRTLVARLAAGREVAGLCNNAGYGDHGWFHEADLEWHLGMVRLNCEALLHLTGAVLPGMVARGAGNVLNVASLAAFQPLPNLATYSATKAFVQSFSEAVHTELAGTGVSVTSFCPGPVHTEFGANAGVGHLEQSAPELAYVDAGKVARRAVAAMVAGRRSAIPAVRWKVTAVAGRLVPRTLFLPVARRVR